MKRAKQELLVLWKIEINSAVSKKKETLELPAPKAKRIAETKADIGKRTFMKLRKVSRGKHAVN